MRSLILFLFLFLILIMTSCATHVVPRPNAITVIKTPPRHYTVVKVNGSKYCFWNGNHYRKTRRGYIYVKI
ncbi:MAG TPA: hypothetical protein VIS27_11660 [Yeosuana sp.]